MKSNKTKTNEKTEYGTIFMLEGGKSKPKKKDTKRNEKAQKTKQKKQIMGNSNRNEK